MGDDSLNYLTTYVSQQNFDKPHLFLNHEETGVALNTKIKYVNYFQVYLNSDVKNIFISSTRWYLVYEQTGKFDKNYRVFCESEQYKNPQDNHDSRFYRQGFGKP